MHENAFAAWATGEPAHRDPLDDRAILSNGPGGPGPRAPNLQGAPEQPKW